MYGGQQKKYKHSILFYFTYMYDYQRGNQENTYALEHYTVYTLVNPETVYDLFMNEDV